MNKLKLRLEDLRVESFRTVDDARGRGTVVGNAYCDTVYDPACGGTYDLTCEYVETCGRECGSGYDSCNNNTCHDSCPDTCKYTCRESCYGCASITDYQVVCDCYPYPTGADCA
ncbi:MAG TPA: hypothetical protein VFQ45_15555 [Longimicrobium sp.]|nr:hypothetical protein [Longimicrobium sp.]